MTQAHTSSLNLSQTVITVAVALTIWVLCGVSTLAANASSEAYDSGRDHGCDDARISDSSDRYINQPEKGPSFHTNSFMNGYYDGFNSCSSSSSQIIDHDNSGSFIVIVEFIDRDIYTGANVRIHGTTENINLLEDSWVRFEFAKDTIPAGSNFDVSVTAYNEYDDTRHLNQRGYNGPESEPEHFYFDLSQ